MAGNSQLLFHAGHFGLHLQVVFRLPGFIRRKRSFCRRSFSPTQPAATTATSSVTPNFQERSKLKDDGGTPVRTVSAGRKSR